jgi:hypothetical protein
LKGLATPAQASFVSKVFTNTPLGPPGRTVPPVETAAFQPFSTRIVLKP